MASTEEEFRQVSYFIYMHFNFLFLFSFTCESTPIVFELVTQRKCRVLGCTSNAADLLKARSVFKQFPLQTK